MPLLRTTILKLVKTSESLPHTRPELFESVDQFGILLLQGVDIIVVLLVDFFLFLLVFSVQFLLQP